jgi:hypothetical protein
MFRRVNSDFACPPLQAEGASHLITPTAATDGLLVQINTRFRT